MAFQPVDRRHEEAQNGGRNCRVPKNRVCPNFEIRLDIPHALLQHWRKDERLSPLTPRFSKCVYKTYINESLLTENRQTEYWTEWCAR